MRPGPGLVVMALAFISGARRGSTSSISSKTTITTSSQPPPPPPLPTTLPPTTTTKRTYQLLTVTTTTTTTTPPPSTSPTTKPSIFFPTTTATTSLSTSSSSTVIGDTITTTSSSPQQVYEDFLFYASPSLREPEEFGDNDDDNNNSNDQTHYLTKYRPKEPVAFDFFNTFFTRTFPTSTSSLNSYPSTSNYFAYTYPLPSHLAKYYDDPRSRTESNSVSQTAKHTRRAHVKFRRRRKRRTRSANVNYRGSGSGTLDDITNENLNDSEDSFNALTTSVDSSSSSDSALSDQTTTLARGLPVHFPSLTAADSSRSLDEDDIFALVAEDDLLSEESFDHLVKLTNDKIGDTNEEDYSSGTESVVESSSGSGSGRAHSNSDNDNDNDNDNNNDNDVVQGINNDVGKNVENDDNDDDNNTDTDGGARDHETESENDVETMLYNAHLVSNSNEKLASITETEALDAIVDKGTVTTATTTTKTVTKTTIHPKAELDDPNSPNRYRSILESNFALTRLNPWISACDLAQPGPLSAPDLQ
ncbi:hypothetical protein DOY81_010066, partial [Sarcophaga bullata]